LKLFGVDHRGGPDPKIAAILQVEGTTLGLMGLRRFAGLACRRRGD
jgi:hypothetical protein